MQKTLEVFQEQQQQALQILGKIKAFMQRGEELGVEIDRALQDKIDQAMQSQGGKLKVALVGGFSEGKTSIAAAWLERLDKSSMKITHEESSDAIKIYDVDGQIELVDTPGLFGFKEKHNDATHEVEKYKDITKKHVSEAHLILYVMNPMNPIKESHEEDLHWLFRDLNLLPRSVFVLSKFDEVADVENEQEYQQKATIKKDVVRGRLKDMIHLDNVELKDLCIVAIAANPFDLGIETWLQEFDKFKQLSHIALLQQATEEKIKSNGGGKALALETQKSVMRDLLHTYLPKSQEMTQTINEGMARLQEVGQSISLELGALEQDITRARGRLREFATRYFSDLILQVEGTSLETIREFFAREVGEGGINIDTKIRNQFEQELGAVDLKIQEIELEFQDEMGSFEKILFTYGKHGLKYLSESGMVNGISAGMVLAARDGLRTGLNMIGIDVAMKFQPWGAVKLAKGLGTGLSALLSVASLALEVFDSAQRAEQEEKFQEAQESAVKNFNQQKQEVLDLINAPDFIARFFPRHGQLLAHVQIVQSQLESMAQKQADFQAWLEQGKTLDVEVREWSQ